MIRNFMVILSPLALVKKAWGSSLLAKILILVLSYFEPIKSIYHLTIIVVIINFIIGFYKSKVIFGENFIPRKARHTGEKIVIFTLYLTIVYAFEMLILNSPALYTTRILAGILILAELKSISENGDLIIGKKIFSTMYRGIKKIFDSRTQPKETEENGDN